MRQAIALLIFLGACGGTEEPVAPEMRIAFQAHALTCDVPGMQAYLKATGVEGVCPLQVSSDHRVTGVCVDVPAGGVRNFRLLYYYDLGAVSDPELALAAVLATLDLRDQREKTVLLQFPADNLMMDYDDDGDDRSNIMEFCAGTNPRQAD